MTTFLAINIIISILLMIALFVCLCNSHESASWIMVICLVGQGLLSYGIIGSFSPFISPTTYVKIPLAELKVIKSNHNWYVEDTEGKILQTFTNIPVKEPTFLVKKEMRNGYNSVVRTETYLE